MKAFIIASYGVFLISSTFAAPLGEEDASSAANILGKRADEIKTINGAPTADPTCQGSAVKVSDIRLALSQGVRWQIDGVQNGDGNYPHEFTNVQGYSWPNTACKDQTVYEYPVMRTIANPWVPGKNTKLNSKANPDRVIFTAQSKDEGTYCGMVTHNYDKNNPVNGQPGAYEQCVESSTATQPTPAVVAPVDPPSQPICIPVPTGSVRDAHEGELQKAVKYFCDQHATDTNAQAPIKNEATIIAGTRQEGRAVVDIAHDYLDSMGAQDDVYDFTLQSVDNCTPEQGNNLASPVANSKCADILYKAWKNCNNQGRGGEITAGCLTYSVHTWY